MINVAIFVLFNQLRHLVALRQVSQFAEYVTGWAAPHSKEGIRLQNIHRI